MFRKDIISSINQLKKSCEKNSSSANLRTLLSQLQLFLDNKEIKAHYDYDQANIGDTQLFDFLCQHPDLQTFWQSCFQQPVETNTQLFWSSPLRDLFGSRLKLHLAGMQKNVLEELENSRVLHPGYAFGRLVDGYNLLFNKIKAIRDYKSYLPQIKTWEVLCLSGKPEALDYAFNTLGVKSDTVNARGESPIHLAVLSNSRQQIYKAHALGCNLQQKTTGEKLTPLEIAGQYHYEDMITYLKHLTHDVSAPQKVTVYVDLGIASTRYNTDAKKLEEYGSKQLLPQEVAPNKAVDFELIARRLRYASAQYMMQVGESPDEVKAILDQHSYYKHATAYYAVKLYVDLADLSNPMSEQEILGPNSLNARGGTHWLLKKKANIKAEDIQEIALCVNHNPHLPKIERCVNPKTGAAETMSPHHSESLRERIKAFLTNENFWKIHTHPTIPVYGFPSFPSPVRQMAALCEKEDSFSLKNFQRIAQDNVAKESTGLTRYIFSFFGPDVTTNSFYKKILQSKSLYEVVDWIDAHDKESGLQLNNDRNVVSLSAN